MAVLFSLLLLAGVGLYLLTPDERRRLFAAVLRLASDAVREGLRDDPEGEPFRTALRARVRRPVLAPAFVLASTAVLVAMWLDRATPAGAALTAWGANYAPLTTNGQWWRLAASLFVHDGLVHLAASAAGLLPLGLVLERFVGRPAFAAVLAASGLIAGLVTLSTSPVTVAAGPAGAILGIHGLLAASALWALVRRPPFAVPVRTFRAVGAASALFLLHTLLAGPLPLDAAAAGFLAGFAGGMAIARGVSQHLPPARRVLATAAATLVIAVVSALPLRGLVNVLPEIDRLLTLEARSSAAYGEAVERFRKGWESDAALASLIEERILPDLDAARTRLQALGKVPEEHRELVAAAATYLALREQSWRQRAEALRSSSLRRLQDAEAVERRALAAFETLRSPPGR